MTVRFPYQSKPSAVFGKVFRPVVKVKIWSTFLQKYLDYTFVADTGADYTLLPQHHSLNFGIELKKDCSQFLSQGIGGTENVYFFEKGLKFQIGKWVKNVPVGFLTKDDIPPLLGRRGCLDELNICFKKFETVISSK